MLKLALLDIGSNSIHMVLTEIQPDFSYKILDRCKDVPRLGEETFQTGQLSPDAIAKGIEVVRTFTTLARNRGLDRKSTRLNSSHLVISYAVFCLKKKKTIDRAGIHSEIPEIT